MSSDTAELPLQADIATKPARPGEYRVGTLVYTKFTLISTIFWLMFGSLAFGLMESVFPNSITLQLKRLEVPEQWMPVLVGTFGQVINLVLSPVFSFRSDRTRSRWGRRIPYIAITIPPLCLSLVGLGFTDDIGAYIHRSNWPAYLHLSPLTTVMLAVGALIMFFQTFNAILNTVYWYLSVDVIPVEMLGRFNGIGGVVGSATTWIFSTFVYGRLVTHTRHVYIGAAIVYLVGMGLMCWRVREGQYPPVTDEAPQPSRWRRLVADIKTYARECFVHPVFIAYYAYNALLAMANAGSFAVSLFYIYYLGFSMDRMGKFNGILALVGMGLAFPIGWLVDRMHPIRATILATACFLPLNLATYFMGSFTMYMVVAAIRLPISRLLVTAQGTMTMRLLPKEQYGQFCSANDMIRSGVMMFGSIVGGLYVGHFHETHGNAGYAYFWLWATVFDSLGLVSLFVVNHYWRKIGGERFVLPPTSG